MGEAARPEVVGPTVSTMAKTLAAGSATIVSATGRAAENMRNTRFKFPYSF